MKNKFVLSIKLFFILVLIINITFDLTSCTFDSQQIYDSLLPNILIILVHTFSTILLIILSIWLVWKPTKKNLDNRREYIEKTLVEAENAKKESFARLIESEQQRLKAYSDAEIIIKNAQGESNYHFDNIVKQAQDDAEQIKRSAKNEIKDYKKNLEVDNNKKIIDIAFLASEKIIKKNINLKDNKKIINDFVKQQTTRKENN